MSHSKYIKRGDSYHFKSYGADAKRFIVQCAGCGRRGFRPSVLDDGFPVTLHRWVIRKNLEETLEPLELDEAGLCAECAQTVKDHTQH